MTTHKNVAPVIIKRKKIIVSVGHHGGAWKVAYADFVNAMMAFFMLNATTEQQRAGLADYFSPTFAINRTSGGGDSSCVGDSIFTEDTLTRQGIGGHRPFIRPKASDRVGHRVWMIKACKRTKA